MEDYEILKLKRKLRIISAKFYFLTAIIIAFSLFSYTSKQNVTFDEIFAKKITITEPNGQPRLVLANSQNSPDNLERGKPMGINSGGRPGIIFYNDEYTECGGLVFAGRKDSLTGKYFASGHFSFDQYNQNQVLYLQYLDDNGSKATGLYVDDWHKEPIYSEFRKTYKAAQKIDNESERNKKLNELRFPKNGEPAFANRVFIGKDTDKNAVVNLSDPNGNIRLQLKVDSIGNAKILFLDEKGKITSKFPEK